jgi:transposase
VTCLAASVLIGICHLQLGHTVKLMHPKYVKPYVKTNKNDGRDAEAICEAMSRLHPLNRST